jgi:hypothetical protein
LQHFASNLTHFPPQLRILHKRIVKALLLYLKRMPMVIRALCIRLAVPQPTEWQRIGD